MIRFLTFEPDCGGVAPAVKLSFPPGSRACSHRIFLRGGCAFGVRGEGAHVYSYHNRRIERQAPADDWMHGKRGLNESQHQAPWMGVTEGGLPCFQAPQPAAGER